MQGLALLRELLAHGAPTAPPAPSGTLPPDELRYLLEYAAAPNLNEQRARIAALLGSSAFVLEPLGSSAILGRFLALRFPQLERTLANRDLFAIGYALADGLQLLSAEPELGSAVFADPLPPVPGDTTESAAVTGLCWVTSPPPADRRWALKTIRAVDAWQHTKGAGIVVAQPDTGVAVHDELAASALALEQAADILDNDPDPTDPLDPHTANPGHGTGTASVVVSREDGAMAGAAPAARLAPIRCISDVKVFNTGPVAAAIAHATDAGCHVISMSLGGVPGRAMRRAIRAAIAADCIVLAAAGNCVRLVVWPAKYGEVIAVGGTNVRDEPWKGSSRGSAVDVCAPAELVWRAERNEQSDPTSHVAAGQGTSFAVALVAGCAALWLSTHGRQAVIQEAQGRGTSVQMLFRSALRASARVPAGWEHNDFGAGIVDALALLQLPLDDIPPVAESAANPTLDLLDGATLDPAFDAERYGLEVAAIGLAQAKLGGAPDAIASEAKVAETRPSPQLSRAAAASADPRLRRLAEAPAHASVARPAVLATVPIDMRRVRLVVPRSAGLESAGGQLDVPGTRAYFAGTGRQQQLDHAEHVFANNAQLSGSRRGDALAQIDEAMAAIARGDGAFTRAAHVGLEALVRLTGRPAIRVRNGTIDLADPRVGEWHDDLFLLLQQPDFLQRIGSAGRIDLDGVHVGSGAVVGPGLVLTNRHVLQALAAPVPRRHNPERWILTGDHATIDFADDPSSATAATRFRITGVVGAGPSHIDENSIDFADLDAALLDVSSTNAAGQALPAPVGLARAAHRVDARRTVIVAGYPARPGVLPKKNGAIDVEVAQRLNELFGLDYSAKYIAPGQIDRSTGGLAGDTQGWTVSHDATTLGGNSGSCIFGIAEPLGVVGLHFGGGWLRANYGHAVGSIARAGNFLADARIRWVD